MIITTLKFENVDIQLTTDLAFIHLITSYPKYNWIIVVDKAAENRMPKRSDELLAVLLPERSRSRMVYWF